MKIEQLEYTKKQEEKALKLIKIIETETNKGIFKLDLKRFKPIEHKILMDLIILNKKGFKIKENGHNRKIRFEYYYIG